MSTYDIENAPKLDSKFLRIGSNEVTFRLPSLKGSEAWEHWVSEQVGSLACMDAGCPLCIGAKHPKRHRVLLRAIDRDANCVKVLDAGAGLIRAIADANAKLKSVGATDSLTNYELRAKRDGGSKPRYKVWISDKVNAARNVQDQAMLMQSPIDLAKFQRKVDRDALAAAAAEDDDHSWLKP